MTFVRPFASNEYFDDWFLPSLREFEILETNLYDQGVGNYLSGVLYWTSSESSYNSAYAKEFNSSSVARAKSELLYSIPVRTFIAPAGTYSLTDIGPAGGWIFYISNTTYYESSPNHIPTSVWSNLADTDQNNTNLEIGTGSQNTLAIVGMAGHITSAAQKCLDFTIGSTITQTNQVGQLAIAYTGQTGDRYDLDYGGVKWYMGADEDPGYVIARKVPNIDKPEFWRTDSKSDSLFLSYANYISRISGKRIPFYDTNSASIWLNANGFWTTYSGITGPEELKVTIDTTASGTSPSDTFTFAVVNISTDYYVDWGDGSGEETFTSITNPTHTYTTGGSYQISIRGGITQMSFYSTGDQLKVKSLNQWGNMQFQNCTSMFRGCSLTSNFSDIPYMTDCTTFRDMFYGANIQGMSLDNWDTSNVTDMWGMFDGSTFSGTTANWDTSSVTDMTYMFGSTPYFNSDISHFNTSNVQSFHSMFGYASVFNQPVNHFDTRSGTTFTNMFRQAYAFNQDVDNFIFTSATSLSSMFNNAQSFNGAVGNWTFKPGTTLHYMFFNADSFNQPVSGWDISNVTEISGMFFSAGSFNQSVNEWDTSNCNTMEQMFQSSNIKQNFSGFIISGLTANSSALNSFCSNTNINEAGTTTNYDVTLVSWAAQGNIPNGLSPTFGMNYGAGTPTNGTTTGISGYTLIDSTATFTSTVSIGDVVHNKSVGTYARVLYITNNSSIGIDVDIIIASGTDYGIYKTDAAKARAKFVIDYGWTISDLGPSYT